MHLITDYNIYTHLVLFCAILAISACGIATALLYLHFHKLHSINKAYSAFS